VAAPFSVRFETHRLGFLEFLPLCKPLAFILVLPPFFTVLRAAACPFFFFSKPLSPFGRRILSLLVGTLDSIVLSDFFSALWQPCPPPPFFVPSFRKHFLCSPGVLLLGHLYPMIASDFSPFVFLRGSLGPVFPPPLRWVTLHPSTEFCACGTSFLVSCGRFSISFPASFPSS